MRCGDGATRPRAARLESDDGSLLAPIGQPGGLGRRRHLLPQPQRAHRGIEGRPAAATSTIASTRRTGPSCSSRPRRTASSGPGQEVRIRRDSAWNVPEPELALAVNAHGRDHRLHHRQRHELARHRGRESRSTCRRPRSTRSAAGSARQCTYRRRRSTPRTEICIAIDACRAGRSSKDGAS